MTMLCSTLRSFQRLAIVLCAVPLGWSAGRLISGQPFGFLAILGILALIDMIAENAVIPIEQIEGERRAGSEVHEAVIEACPRFRPIMPAALSTVVALIPIAPIALGGRRPFAIMRGLLVASLPTLLVPPTACVTGLERGRASPSPAPRVANRLVPAREMP